MVSSIHWLFHGFIDARWGKVKTAESQENPLAALPSFTSFNKNGVKFNLETKK